VLNGNNYFLTKLRRSFAKNEMDDDLYLKFEDNNETFHMEITRGADTEIDFQETKTLSESYNNNDYESNQKNFTDVKTNRVKVYYLFIFGGVIFLLAVIVVLFVFIKKRRKESTEKQELTTDEDQIQEE
jgi:flagellar biosynthesis/type III secretory pathway M-ring protein FliF/YscJ